jgi:hypothetical protein
MKTRLAQVAYVRGITLHVLISSCLYHTCLTSFTILSTMSSPQWPGHPIVEEQSENSTIAAPPNHFVEAPNAEDVVVPTQLLQATGNIGSSRDRGGSLTWKPQPSFPSSSDRLPGSLKRHSTQTSYDRRNHFHTRTLQDNPLGFARQYSNGQVSTSPFSTTEQRRRSGPGPRFSYIPGSNDVLSIIPRDSRPTTGDGSTNGSSIWTKEDPFSTSKDSIDDDSERMPHRTRTADDAYEEQGPRGTLHAIADAVVPDVIQRRFTNVSHTRRSSTWHIYEKAKERGVQLQRNKITQTAFEYGIYIVLILIVYFVLIGVPLWKGAVYWLWWVVANKFVFAGGFSITLGIALL